MRTFLLLSAMIGVASAICRPGSKFDDETGKPCAAQQPAVTTTTTQPPAIVRKSKPSAYMKNVDGVATILGEDVVFKTSGGDFSAQGLSAETASVKTNLLQALAAAKDLAASDLEAARAEDKKAAETITGDLRDSLQASITDSASSAKSVTDAGFARLTAAQQQQKLQLENVIQNEIKTKLQPLSDWKKQVDACTAKGEILGASGCEALSKQCPAIKSNGLFVVPSKLEFLPGVSMKIECKAGYGMKTPVTTDCLSTGKWSIPKGGGFHTAVCEKCKVGDCEECKNGASTCTKCGKNSAGEYGSLSADGKSCVAIDSCATVKKVQGGTPANGLYTLNSGGKSFKTYCDFKVNGGGWTLVASVHEDNIRSKCRGGDLWTNTNGNNGRGHKGLGYWQSTNSFNNAEDAAKKDFKSPGYSTIKAKDIMLWHVPNGRGMSDFYDKAFYRQYSTTNFLKSYGNTLQQLYTKKPPISQQGTCNSGREGPHTAVKWDKGSASNYYWNDLAPNSRGEMRMNYIDFTIYNWERAALAMCPSGRYTGCNAEHACLGGGGYFPEGGGRQCSDFSGWDWSGYGSHGGWSASRRLTEAAVLIFTR